MRVSGIFILAALAAASGTAARAATPAGPDAGEAARRSAVAMNEAFLSADYEAYAQYMYPRLIEKMGGKAAVIAEVKKGMAGLRAEQGMTPKSFVVELPLQIVRAGDELHAVLPTTVVLSAPDGEMHLPSHLIGISADNGKTWTFIDTTSLTPDNVKIILPNFNPALVIPPKQEPVFVSK